MLVNKKLNDGGIYVDLPALISAFIRLLHSCEKKRTSVVDTVEDIPLCYIIKHTIYVVTVKHNCLLCL